MKFLSTLPARGATTPPSETGPDGTGISIHAPREGSDDVIKRAGLKVVRFLSTLPARGATTSAQLRRARHDNFYPRSPRGERLCVSVLQICNIIYFYPRSPRGERQQMC